MNSVKDLVVYEVVVTTVTEAYVPDTEDIEGFSNFDGYFETYYSDVSHGFFISPELAQNYIDTYLNPPKLNDNDEVAIVPHKVVTK